jgi:hypothetical protein
VRAQMFQMQGALNVMHWHGGDDWVPMNEGEHGVASHDPERAWLRGARIFKCSSCAEQIAIAPENPRDLAEPEHPHPGI